MEKELKIDLEKYLIVVEGQEEKVVYDVDDSSIFSSKIVGCGRGARNAVVSKKTFKTLDEANLGIKYLDSCFRYKFKAIKVSELKKVSRKGWDILVEDVIGYNWSVNFNNNAEKESNRKQKVAYLELRQKAISLVSNNHVYSIEEDSEEEGVVIIRISKSC